MPSSNATSQCLPQEPIQSTVEIALKITSTVPYWRLPLSRIEVGKSSSAINFTSPLDPRDKGRMWFEGERRGGLGEDGNILNPDVKRPVSQESHQVLCEIVKFRSASVFVVSILFAPLCTAPTSPSNPHWERRRRSQS